MQAIENFLKQIWQRRVVQFGAIYLGAAWVLLQVAALLENTLELPNWVDQSALVLLALGFPLVLILAWAQESKAPSAESREDTIAASEGDGDQPGSGDIPSVAVLPMVNMSDDREKEFFADGMTEDIITGLSKSKHISVISRTSTFGYKGQSPDVRTVAEELSVRYVVEGSVRSVADRVRITVQLIDATSGSHVWAENYDRPAEQLFEIQDDVIAAITSSLGSGLKRAEAERMRNLKPQTLSAWQAVQQANLILISFDGKMVSNNWPGIAELRRTCQEEPNYAYAHSLLAWALSNMIVNGYSDHISSDYREAMEHLESALSLASDDPLNLHYCAYAMAFMGRHKDSLGLCKRVLELDPNYIDVYITLGIAYAYLGQYEDAHAAFDNVEKLAPMGLHFQVYPWHRANLLSLEGRHEDAIVELRKVIQQWPHYASPYYFLAIAMVELGRKDEARQAIVKALEIYPDHSLSRIQVYLQAHPDPEEGKRRFQILVDLWPEADAS